jgi:hypothetical protein
MALKNYRELDVWQKAIELETHLIIVGKIGYIDRPEAAAPWNLMQDVGKMLRGMMKRLSE